MSKLLRGSLLCMACLGLIAVICSETNRLVQSDQDLSNTEKFNSETTLIAATKVSGTAISESNPEVKKARFERITSTVTQASVIYLVGGLIIIFLVIGLYQSQIRKKREIERIRKKIARDLHDEIGSNLSTIVIITELIKKKDTLTGSDLKRLEDLLKITQEVTDSLRDIVWFINPENDDSGDLILKMKELTNRMLPDVNVNFRVQGTAFLKDADLEKRKNIYLILKEALHNIVKHASATEVNIIIESRHDHNFKMIIKDNGAGLNAEILANTNGNGIKNMQERARSLGAKMHIPTENDSGCVVKVFSS